MRQQDNQWPGDTDKDAAERHVETLQNMGIGGRAEMTFQLSDNLRSVMEAGIRQRHPDYSHTQITQAALRLVLDEELFEQVFPGCEVQP